MQRLGGKEEAGTGNVPKAGEDEWRVTEEDEGAGRVKVASPERFKEVDKRWRKSGNPGEGVSAIRGRFATGCAGYARKPSVEAGYAAGHKGITSEEEQFAVMSLLAECSAKELMRIRNAGGISWYGIALSMHQLGIAHCYSKKVKLLNGLLEEAG